MNASSLISYERRDTAVRQYRSLVVVSVLAATGHNEELKTHLRGALNLGWTVDELREALLQTAPYAGFSAANEALQALSAVATRG